MAATFTWTKVFHEDADGQPLKNVPVRCVKISDGSTVGNTTTDATGVYSFAGLTSTTNYRFEARGKRVYTQVYTRDPAVVT